MQYQQTIYTKGNFVQIFDDCGKRKTKSVATIESNGTQRVLVIANITILRCNASESPPFKYNTINIDQSIITQAQQIGCVGIVIKDVFKLVDVKTRKEVSLGPHYISLAKAQNNGKSVRHYHYSAGTGYTDWSIPFNCWTSGALTTGNKVAPATQLPVTTEKEIREMGQRASRKVIDFMNERCGDKVSKQIMGNQIIQDIQQEINHQ